MSTCSRIKPNSWLFIRLPTKALKILEIKPNTIIDVGKLGSFPSNLLLGRPYHYIYEILEKRYGEAYSRLRIIPPSELNAEIISEEATPSESRAEPATPHGVGEAERTLGPDVVEELKNNRLTVDDASRQALSQAEIEELKKSATGREVIEKILASHSGLDEKTVFSKAKYMLRKRNKYLKRFTVLPMEMGYLAEYVLEKEASRILDMREETLGLVTAWSNAHFSGAAEAETGDDRHGSGRRVAGGRWLVVDETGGLVVAALAERMDILRKPEREDEDTEAAQTNGGAPSSDDKGVDGGVSLQANGQPTANGTATATPSSERKHSDFPPPAPTNTLTLLHPAVQPNISLLKHFGYDSNIPDPDHPLHTHLKCLSWLQLLHPEDGPTYREPETFPESTLASWKSGKRGTYWKKRRRWERCKSIVGETIEGGFEGLAIASNMDPTTILPHLVPLVRGGGHIVIYSPTIEPLVQVMDLYSKERRTAYINHLAHHPPEDPPPVEDFPVDPTLLLAPMLQTSRVREWQVLPGRTHPLMTGRGGAEGYVFTARRVIPLEGGVEARGNFVGKGKRRKVHVDGEGGAVVAGAVEATST